MKFAKIVFRVAGIWGFLILTPLYFLFDVIGRKDPPPITHPAFFYGFVGLALVWQAAFLVIAGDPVRFRPLMLVAILEKAAYAIPVALLVAAKRTAPNDLVFAGTDAMLGFLFVLSYLRTPKAAPVL
jgi:hypothetical protein